MRRIKGEVDKPWLFRLAPNEVDGRIREQVGAVALDLVPLGFPVHIVHAVIGVSEVIDVAGAKTEELIESAIGRPAAGCEADVPLAEAGGRLARLLEVLRKDTLAMRESDAHPVLRAG